MIGPDGNPVDAGRGQADVGRQTDALNFPGDVRERGAVLFGSGAAGQPFAILRLTPVHLQRSPTFPRHESGDAEQDDNERDSHHDIDMRGFFQFLDELRPHLHAADGADDHDAAEFEIDVAQGAVFAGGHDGFADNVREVRAHHKIHRHAKTEKRRPRQKAASHTKEPAEQTNDEPDANQVQRIDVDAGDREIHFTLPSPA